MQTQRFRCHDFLRHPLVDLRPPDYQLLCSTIILNYYSQVGVSWNRGTPSHHPAIRLGFSFINHPIWGYPHDYGNPHIIMVMLMSIMMVMMMITFDSQLLNLKYDSQRQLWFFSPWGPIRPGAPPRGRAGVLHDGGGTGRAPLKGADRDSKERQKWDFT